MRQWSLGLLGLILCLITATAYAAHVSASVDRNSVHMGETLTLTITVDDSSQAAKPDLDALGQDFDVLQTSTSSNYNIINGKTSSSRVWGVALQPRHTGNITIAPIAVAGEHTQALVVSVLPAATGAQGGPGDDVFVETSVTPLTVYVGQQALYRVKLFYAAGMVPQGDLQQPQVDGVDLRQLGKGERHQTQRGGRSYAVVERDYALTSDTAGSVSLPGISFRGHVGNNGGFPGFMSHMRSVDVRSPSLTLQVKAKPATAASGPWLPAQELSLSASGLPADGKAKVGDPITLTLTVKAKGLPFEDLPALSLPDIAGARVYPDKPDTSTSNDGQWLHGQRQRSFAIVPTQAGTLTIPAISLPWWNVESDKPAVANLPARTLTIAAADGSVVGPPAAPMASAVTSTVVSAASIATPVSADVNLQSTSARTHVWRWLALALLLLWLLTLLTWWWLRRRSRRTATVATSANPQQELSVRQARQGFKQALPSGDAARISRSLLAWAQSERPALTSLGAVAAALSDHEQRQAISALQQNRYGTADASFDSTNLGQALAQGFKWQASPQQSKAADGLPPLYPFANHGERDQ
ncbi:MAG: BatD family protein [Xanthomonadales bacterium]|nr:BatD family protein [Xanthomonadales bacterium]